jgi:hypothetical protein
LASSNCMTRSILLRFLGGSTTGLEFLSSFRSARRLESIRRRRQLVCGSVGVLDACSQLYMPDCQKYKIKQEVPTVRDGDCCTGKHSPPRSPAEPCRWARSTSPRHSGPSISRSAILPPLRNRIPTEDCLDVQHILSDPSYLLQRPTLLPATGTQGQSRPLALELSVHCGILRLFTGRAIGLRHHDFHCMNQKLPLVRTLPPSPPTNSRFIWEATSDRTCLLLSRGDSSSRREVLNSEALSY